MQQVHQQVQATLKDIYRKAIDADNKLNALQQQNKGKFQSIFSEDMGFETKAKRFLPYVEELTAEFERTRALTDEEFKEHIPGFVAKLELILRTLTRFSQQTKKT